MQRTLIIWKKLRKSLKILNSTCLKNIRISQNCTFTNYLEEDSVEFRKLDSQANA